MKVLEYVAGGFFFVAIVNIALFSPNTPGVLNSVFSGSSTLFGALTTNNANK